MKNNFKKQNNIAAGYHEIFLVNQNRDRQFQPNAVHLDGYGESHIAPGGITQIIHGHYLSNWGLELICSGRGEFICGSTRIPLLPGHLCIVSSDVSAEIKAAKDSPLHKRVAMLERSAVISLLCTFDFSTKYEVLMLSAPDRVNRIFDAVKRACESGGEDQYFELSVTTYKLLLEIGRQRLGGSGRTTLRALLMKITSDPGGDYSRENMAEMLGTNIRTLTQRFTEAVGVPPGRFVIRKRLEYACELLNSSSLSIHQVAEACGYRDPAFFSREFKKHYGRPPGKFLKRISDPA